MYPNTITTQENMSLGSNGVDQVLWLRKITTRLRGTNFCINCTSSVCFATSSCSYEKIPNAPEHYEMHQNMIYGPMGWIRYFGCEKLQRDFMARTFALIAPVLSVLQQVSCSCETIPNAPKYYETHQNISLGCNGADWVHSLGKNPSVTSQHELLH